MFQNSLKGNAATNQCKTHVQATSIDHACRTIFPLAFLLFNAIYWSFYLSWITPGVVPTNLQHLQIINWLWSKIEISQGSSRCIQWFTIAENRLFISNLCFIFPSNVTKLIISDIYSSPKLEVIRIINYTTKIQSGDQTQFVLHSHVWESE